MFLKKQKLIGTLLKDLDPMSYDVMFIFHVKKEITQDMDFSKQPLASP